MLMSPVEWIGMLYKIAPGISAVELLRFRLNHSLLYWRNSEIENS